MRRMLAYKLVIGSPLLALALAGCGGSGNIGSTDGGNGGTPGGELTCSQLATELGHDLSLWPELTPPIAEDPAIEQAITEILGQMSLEQKIGQMVQADIGYNAGPERPGVVPDELKQYHLGSVLNGGNSYPDNDPYAPTSVWLSLAEEFYNASVDSEGVSVAIPYIWGTDAVHGHTHLVGATIFPQNIGLGAANDPDLIRRVAEVTAREIAVSGMDWDFAPTIAVARNDWWGRTYESFAEKPELVAAYAEAYVKGLQGEPSTESFLDGEHVLATAKHFVGDGGTIGGVDQGDTEISEADLVAIHAAGYQTALAAGAQTVMASYNRWNGEKVHGQRYLLTCVLRERFHFDGFVIGDWNAHGQIGGCANNDCPQAITAGVDMFMIPSFDDWPGFITNTVARVNAGEIPMARIDEAVRRILRVKMRFGLLGPNATRSGPTSRPLAGSYELVGSAEHRAVAREAVRKSLVLLKNKGSILPLARSGRVVVAGKSASSISNQAGGWTINWQGTGHTNDNFPNAQTIFSGIQQAVVAGGGRATLDEDASSVTGGNYDVAIVVIGETPYAEFFGDIDGEIIPTWDPTWVQLAKTMEHGLRYPEDRAVIEQIRAADPDLPIVTVFLSGRPLYVNHELNLSDAFVAAWLPGGEGGGIADLLYSNGQYDFSGKLSFSWPEEPCQSPLNNGDGQTPLFGYGYGLTYADIDELGDDLPTPTNESCVP